MPLLRRVARPMLAAVFISGGINALRRPQAHADAAKPVLDFAAPAIDKAVELSPLDKRPDAETLVKVEAGVKIGAGTLLALGRLPRTSSALLAATLVPTTLAEHRFWEESDPETRRARQVQFLTDVSLFGGLLIAAADTHGKPSVAWRSRKAAEATTAALEKRAEALSDAAHSAGGLVSGLGGSSASVRSDLAGKAAVLSGVASERARELSSKAAAKAEKRGAALQKAVDKRGAAWRKELDKQGRALEKLADRMGSEWTAASREQRAAWEAIAERKRAEWEKSAHKAVRRARKQAPGYVDRLTALAAQASKLGGDVASRAADAGTAGREAVEGIAEDARRRARALR